MIKRTLSVIFLIPFFYINCFAQKTDVHQKLELVAKLLSARKYAEAEAGLKEIDSSKLDKNSLTKGFYYQQMARLNYYVFYDDAKAVDYYYKAIHLYELNKSNDDIGMAYSNVAGILTDLKDFKRAEEAIQKALPLVKNDKVRYGNLLVNHARIKTGIGDNAKSTELNFAALKLYEETGDKSRVGSSYFQLGINMEMARQLDKALDFYSQSLKIRKELADTLGTTRVLNNMGIVYKNQLKYDKAVECYEQSAELATQWGRPVLKLPALINLAVIAKRKGDLKKSIALNNEALDLAVANKRESEAHTIENNLCEVYMLAGDYAKAVPLAQSLVQYAKTKGTLEEKVAFHNNLAEALYGTGQKEAGFKNLQIAFDMRDSLYKKHSADAMAEMVTKYETEKKEARIRLLASEGKWQKLLLNNQRLELDKKELEIGARDTRLDLQRAQLEREQLAGQQQAQRISLLNNEKAISELELSQKNTYLLLSFVVILFIIFLAFMFYRRRKLQENLTVQREKLRISQELHDNIGSQLTFINNFVQSFHTENGQGGKLQEAREVTANTIRELRRTVWLINQPEFVLDEFIIKLRDYVRPYETGKPLISITAANTLSNCVLKPTTATHLFRIIQEAVNNSLKYADASELTIAFNKKNNSLQVTITDDGHGFNQAEISAGYGLKNINSRANLLKGQSSVTSKPGCGTSVQVNVPV